jgi:hypothetical protein
VLSFSVITEDLTLSSKDQNVFCIVNCKEDYDKKRVSDGQQNKQLNLASSPDPAFGQEQNCGVVKQVNRTPMTCICQCLLAVSICQCLTARRHWQILTARRHWQILTARRQYLPVSPGCQYFPVSPGCQYLPVSPGCQYLPVSPGCQFLIPLQFPLNVYMFINRCIK